MNNIDMEKSSTPAAIIEIVGKEKAETRSKRSGLFPLGHRNEDFTDRSLDCKDFRARQQPRSKPK
jgi:hypothetical protein